MKKEKIGRIIRQFLIVFPLFFTLKIIFAYIRGGVIDIPDELIETAIFSVLFIVFNSCYPHNQKVEKAQDNANKAE